MRTIQARCNVLYRFRCRRCRSQFEITAEEELNSIAKERPITNDDIRDVLGLNEP